MRHNSGATLIEVLVVCGIFFVLSGAILVIYTSMIRIEKQVSLKTDLDRIIITAVRHIDTSLRSARLLEPQRPDAWTEPVEVSRLKLAPLKVHPDGTPVITTEGFPDWEVPFIITFERGELVRENTDRRVLARVGPDGNISFLRPNKNLLKMRISAKSLGQRGYETSRDTTFQFRLFNQ